MRRSLPPRFVCVKICKACGYKLPWRVKDRVYFARKWEGTCPHCGGEFREGPLR